jgi:hypothetical protein
MKMILSSLNLVRKIGVCITSEESKLTSEENLFNNLLPTYYKNLKHCYFALIKTPDPEDLKNRGVK